MTSNEINECTFSPKVNSPSKNLLKNNEKDLSVAERLLKSKEKLRAKLNIMKKHLEVNFPFKPKISKNTDKILKQKELLLNKLKMEIHKPEKSKLEKLGADKSPNLDSIEEFERIYYKNRNNFKLQNSFCKERSNYNHNSIESPLGNKKMKESKASSIYNDEDIINSNDK
jgi:hypothetical protein